MLESCIDKFCHIIHTLSQCNMLAAANAGLDDVAESGGLANAQSSLTFRPITLIVQVLPALRCTPGTDPTNHCDYCLTIDT